MADQPAQRVYPLGFDEIGSRLGMQERFALLAQLDAQGDPEPVSSTLVEICQELEARGNSEALVADVLEKLGEYHLGKEDPGRAGHVRADGADTALSGAALWEQCLAIRTDHLGASHSDTVFIRYLLGSWYANIGENERAVTLLEQNLEYWEDESSSRTQLSCLAMALSLAWE